MERNSYIKDFIKWQRDMYLPGAYTGGDLPPYIKYPNRKTAILVSVLGIGSTVAFVVSLVKLILENNPEENTGDILNVCAFALIGVFFITCSVLMFRKYSKTDKNK